MVLKHSNRKFKSRSVKTKGYYILLAFLILILFDRMTKIWAASLNISKDYGIVAFTYMVNTGAGFSILSGMNLLLIIISILALILLIYFNITENAVPRFSFVTIISGIIGNLIDRISYGGVIDFINLKFWPVFNVADSLIFIGTIYWIIIIIRGELKDRNASKK